VRSRSQGHRSTRATCAALALSAVLACSKDTVVTTRNVYVDVPSACAVAGHGFATYAAQGDFEPTSQPLGPDLSDVGAVLVQLDGQTRELGVSVSLGTSAWEGRTSVPPKGDVNVLVLPADLSCALTRGVGMRTGSTLGVIGSQRALLVGGTAMGPVPEDFVVHLDTGQVTPVAQNLKPPRSHASVSTFDAGGLVAGGTSDDGTVQQDAWIFDPAAEGFTQSIVLDQKRTGHSAVALLDGRTLLVGGTSDAAGRQPIQNMELVDPTNDQAYEQGVAPLDPPLTSPVAVLLASGEVLVAGGTTATSPPSTGLQWFRPCSSQEGCQVKSSAVAMGTIPAGAALSIVALQGGGALAVVAPPAGAGANFSTTWVIGADHTVDAAGSSVAGTLSRPLLFGGVGGAPLLWTSDRWLQWQPWSASFTAAPVLDNAPANVGDAVASVDPGLAMWLDPSQNKLVALRTATDDAYSPDPASFLSQGPGGVAPDRLPGPSAVTYTGGTGLTLSQGASAFVTDRTYADVSVRATFASGQPPYVVLRDDEGQAHVLKDDCCSGLFAATGPSPVVDVERVGGTVTCQVSGGQVGTCGDVPSSSARVSVGVQGASTAGPSVVSEIVVRRLGAP
jgi:hypothetical protein